ncbi:MAG: hypothetical protein RIB45_15965 [Marivibrio sp.]|uniref:hypothetical protein n=1 Tax=Marivibrio sp. TaxID=2039719 RepID=UPI0032EDA7AD
MRFGKAGARGGAWRRAACVASVAGGLLAGGCVTNEQALQEHEKEVAVEPAQLQQFLADKPEALQPFYEVLMRQGRRNQVLNNMRIGAAALGLGEYEAAERAFDEALAGIETIYADNPQAEQARSVWVRENAKDFKGEPYERAMAYYYRGLLYLREGDYQNARASFKGGQLQDAFAEEDQDRADFALLYYLEGWASHCNGDAQLAEDAFAEALKHNAELILPQSDHGLLLVRESGEGPIKQAAGDYQEQLTFAPGAQEEALLAEFTVGDHTAIAPEAEDLFYQASTRGGRQVDHILGQKAQFKETLDATGDALSTAGGVSAAAGLMGGNSDAAMVGALLMIAGAVADESAKAARAEADVRTWDNLPGDVKLATLPLPAAAGEGRVRLFGRDGAPLEGSERRFRYAGAEGCAIAWTRSDDPSDIPPRAPGSGGPAEG